METEEYEFELNGEKYKVVLGVITFEEWADLVDNYVDFDENGKVRGKVGAMGIQLVYYSIKSVEPKPFKNDKEKMKWIKKLPATVSYKLYLLATKLNPLLQ